MNGVLLIDKPEGWTSFDVVAKLRGALGERRLGHAGTLDPLATGILPLLAGTATRLADCCANEDKRYTVTLALGRTTDTQDITGSVLSENPFAVSQGELEAALAPFRGDLWQTPPLYSALKVAGRKLYDYARAGQSVERKPRRISIRRLELLEYEPAAGIAVLDVACSKGSYMRTLVHDFGQALGCGAVLTALRRTEACGCLVEDAHPLLPLIEALNSGAPAPLLPPETLLRGLPELTAHGQEARLLSNGVRLALSRVGLPPDTLGRCLVYTPLGFLGLGEAKNGELRLYKRFGELYPEKEAQA